MNDQGACRRDWGVKLIYFVHRYIFRCVQFVVSNAVGGERNRVMLTVCEDSQLGIDIKVPELLIFN